MQDGWTRVQQVPGPVRAASVGFALIALAVAAWALTPGSDAHRVPVAPILQAETSDPAPAVEPAPVPEPTNTVVSVVEAGGGEEQATDVSTSSSVSAPPSDVSAVASVEQSATSTNSGTEQTSTGESTSDYHSSTTSGDGSTSVSVEVNKSSSNTSVTTGPDHGGEATSTVVNNVSSRVGTTAR